MSLDSCIESICVYFFGTNSYLFQKIDYANIPIEKDKDKDNDKDIDTHIDIDRDRQREREKRKETEKEVEEKIEKQGQSELKPTSSLSYYPLEDLIWHGEFHLHSRKDVEKDVEIDSSSISTSSSYYRYLTPQDHFYIHQPKHESYPVLALFHLPMSFHSIFLSLWW